MNKGILIKTNGKVESITVDGLKDMQAAVDGNIECALTGDVSDTCPDNDDEHWDLWANDEGRLIGLPMNQVARVFVSEMQGCPIESVFSLHGDFLLLGHDGEGGSIDCPESIADMAMSMAMFNEPFSVLESLDTGDRKVIF